MLCCAVLCCAVLCCAVLCCAVLCCPAPCCPAPCCPAPRCARCAVLAALCFAALRWNKLGWAVQQPATQDARTVLNAVAAVGLHCLQDLTSFCPNRHCKQYWTGPLIHKRDARYLSAGSHQCTVFLHSRQAPSYLQLPWQNPSRLLGQVQW